MRLTIGSSLGPVNFWGPPPEDQLGALSLTRDKVLGLQSVTASCVLHMSACQMLLNKNDLKEGDYLGSYFCLLNLLSFFLTDC